MDFDFHIIFVYLFGVFVPSLTNSANKPFSKSVCNSLILKNSIFSGHGLRGREADRVTEKIWPIREYVP
jgi:hypothetical protein